MTISRLWVRLGGSCFELHYGTFSGDGFWTCLLWNLVIASQRSGYFQKKSRNAIRYNTVPCLKRRPEKWPIWTKGFFCTRPFNLICQQMHPFYLLFAKMQNFINKKSEISYESGGRATGSWNAPSPSPTLNHSRGQLLSTLRIFSAKGEQMKLQNCVYWSHH